MSAVPFKDVFTESPSTLYVPGGPLSYWVLAPHLGYTERYVDGGGGTTQVQIAVRWDDTFDFMQWAFGTTTVVGEGTQKKLSRSLPLLCQWTSHQFLTELSKVLAVGADIPVKDPPDPGDPTPGDPYDNGIWFADPFFDNWFWMNGAVIYQASFGNRNYRLLTDAEVDAKGLISPGGYRNELHRYVTRSFLPVYRERRVPNYIFETDEANPVPIPEVGFIPDDGYIDYEYVWRQIPLDAIPHKAMAECNGKVNDAPFDTGYTNKFTKETFLFVGVSRPITEYRHADGKLYCDIHYHFRFRPDMDPLIAGGGWNKQRRLNGTYIGIRAKGQPGVRPWLTADLNRLFRPE